MLGEKILKNGLWLFGRKIAVIDSVFFDQVTCWWITGSFNPVGRHTVKAELLQQLLQGKWMVRSHGCGTFRKRAVGDLAGSVPQILVGKLYLMQVSSTPQDKGLLASARISSAELQGIFLSIGTKTVIVPQPHTIKKWTDDFLFCILSPPKMRSGKIARETGCLFFLHLAASLIWTVHQELEMSHGQNISESPAGIMWHIWWHHLWIKWQF